MEQLIAKAKVLIEALPYIKAFWGKTVVIKYGGAAMTEEALKQDVLRDIVLMKYVGMRPVVVHGGGPEITKAMQQLGKTPAFVDGRRVTDRETMEITEMVLVGKLNSAIVSGLNRHGGYAVGLSGKDGGLIQARKLVTGGVDLGFVGEVTSVRPEILLTLDSEKFIPVISPIGTDEDGNTYNINADDVASGIAAALTADKLVLLTDVPGLLSDPDQPETLMSTLRVGEIADLTARGVIRGGMLPKVRACERALQAGVRQAHIIDGRVPHALLLEIFTDQGIGTEILNT
jgi:acetylglutamate kinase